MSFLIFLDEKASKTMVKIVFTFQYNFFELKMSFKILARTNIFKICGSCSLVIILKNIFNFMNYLIEYVINPCSEILRSLFGLKNKKHKKLTFQII